MRPILITLFLFCCSGQLQAGELDRLQWLAGHWTTADGRAEEGWFAPKGGAMPGIFRWVQPEGRTVVASHLIEETDDGLTLRLEHYGALDEVCEKCGPTTYRAQLIGADSVTFERVSDGAPGPAVIRYRLEGDTLHFEGSGHAGKEPLRLSFERT